MARHRRSRTEVLVDSTPEERALDALALARRGISLSRAARLARTDPRTVRRHVGQAFRKEGRRHVPRPYDRIPRRMTALTPSGPRELVVRDSRTASLLAEHANAVRTYVETGNEKPLHKLRRGRMRVAGEDLELEADPVRLDRLAEGAELHYELYRN